MISFQNKRAEKMNEQQIKLAKIQYIKNVYEQRNLNLANIQKRMNTPVVNENLNSVVSEKSPLQNYIFSVYGK